MKKLVPVTEWRKWIEHVEGWSDQMVVEELKRVGSQIRMLKRIEFHLRDLQCRRDTHLQASSCLAKLSASDVNEIRRLSHRGFSQVWLAKKFRVSQPTIHNLLAGRIVP